MESPVVCRSRIKAIPSADDVTGILKILHVDPSDPISYAHVIEECVDANDDYSFDEAETNEAFTSPLSVPTQAFCQMAGCTSQVLHRSSLMFIRSYPRPCHALSAQWSRGIRDQFIFSTNTIPRVMAGKL